ncbi:hypothetical protein DWUX_1679 [Desulfovibrio diazotrophicus]|nr:hypothetical protein DWUX_1679 [Desulfovibrio diazotrophicus]
MFPINQRWSRCFTEKYGTEMAQKRMAIEKGLTIFIVSPLNIWWS